MAARRVTAILLVLVACSSNGVAISEGPPPDVLAAAAHRPADQRWSFEGDVEGGSPPGFTAGRTGEGKASVWRVGQAPDATDGRQVVSQADLDATDRRYPLLLADGDVFGDVLVSVRYKPVEGHVDQAGGLLARARGADDYYVTRANALEGNVRLYHVLRGRRTQLASWEGEVASGTWHSLALACIGEQLMVWHDADPFTSPPQISFRDRTFDLAGRVGLWTKSDSRTLFDQLEVWNLDR